MADYGDFQGGGDFGQGIPAAPVGEFGQGLPKTAPQSAQRPGGGGGWMSYMPGATLGFSGLGSILQLIQAFQNNRQMAGIRKDAGNWQGAANYKLSGMVGDAASRGLSGSPQFLAGLTSQAYQPYQNASQEMRLKAATPPVTDWVNPFDNFLKALMAYQKTQGQGA